MTQHKEAFALMWYGCECGHRERMWNSRDGVTPFGLTCPSCGQQNLRHINWQLDQPAPQHFPHKGQRVWRDGTPDEAVEIMAKRIATLRAAGRELDQDDADSLLASARSGEQEFQPGWPRLVIVVEKGRVP